MHRHKRTHKHTVHIGTHQDARAHQHIVCQCESMCKRTKYIQPNVLRFLLWFSRLYFSSILNFYIRRKFSSVFTFQFKFA